MTKLYTFTLFLLHKKPQAVNDNIFVLVLFQQGLPYECGGSKELWVIPGKQPQRTSIADGGVFYNLLPGNQSSLFIQRSKINSDVQKSSSA
jgi:hypothetical protein